MLAALSLDGKVADAQGARRALVPTPTEYEQLQCHNPRCHNVCAEREVGNNKRIRVKCRQCGNWNVYSA